MSHFRIQGGVPLSGTVRVSGNKNEALPALAAVLLTDEPMILHNVPDILDVRVMLDILRALGSEVTWLSANSLRIHTKDLKTTALPVELGRHVRASILFAGALLGRAHRVELPPPGGDVIGRRRLDTHFDGFVQLGAQFEQGEIFKLHAKELRGTDLFLDEASVTATENLLMAASVAKGTTVLGNCASEPHVQGIARMLNAMGGKISGIGTNQMVIEGVDRLHGTEFTIGPDYLEVGSFIGLAAVTGGELRIQDAAPEHLRMIRMVFQRLGVRTEVEGRDLLVPGQQDLAVRQDLHGGIPRVDDAIWPQFPTDLMSIAIMVATQSKGTVLFLKKCLKAACFCRRVDRHGCANYPLRSAPCGGCRSDAAVWSARAESRCARRYGVADRGLVRQRHDDHSQYSPNRSRLRKDRAKVAIARRLDRTRRRSAVSHVAHCKKTDERALRAQVVLAKRVVIKVGSQVLCQADGRLDEGVFASLCQDIGELLRQKREVVLVSSGAVASGRGALAHKQMETTLGKQALAAIGQPLLMAHYRQLFAQQQIEVAQVLLTHADLADRGRFLHARRVMAELASAGILTIVNENDTVAVEELKFGDNDALAAQVTHVTGSDVLVLLTEVAGLYTADPQKDPTAKLISAVHGHDDATLALAGDSKTAFGTGGMRSKVAAARKAGDVGAIAVIASGKQPHVLAYIFGGQATGTVFAPGRKN